MSYDLVGVQTTRDAHNLRRTLIEELGVSPSERGRLERIRSFPIGIDTREFEQVATRSNASRLVRQTSTGLGSRKLIIGVDRLDYTKGILERFAAIERLLELEPRWIGWFAFIQIAAPSRSSIEEYQAFDARVRAAAQRVNDRFATPHCRPIILKIEHHDADDVYAHYRAADLCFVSSLHDGMNLVAKEYVAARDDERGVLILSQFAGAAGELPEALIVNPYDTEQCATALRVALDMPPVDQRERMRSMRSLIQEFNVYRWAGRMLLDAARMRHRRRVASGARRAPRVVDLRRA